MRSPIVNVLVSSFVAIAVEGHIFLGPDGNLVRLEGQLATNPSFWTRRVDVVRRYERIAGVRVPVALESVAHVRIAGRSTFRMSYDYLTINDRRVRRDDRCPATGEPD